MRDLDLDLWDATLDDLPPRPAPEECAAPTAAGAGAVGRLGPGASSRGVALLLTPVHAEASALESLEVALGPLGVAIGRECEVASVGTGLDPGPSESEESKESSTSTRVHPSQSGPWAPDRRKEDEAMASDASKGTRATSQGLLEHWNDKQIVCMYQCIRLSDQHQ